MQESTTTEPRGAEHAPPVVNTEKTEELADLPALIARIADGDRDALGELYEATVAKLFALARLILRNDADAEEVVCDVYAQVWQNAAQYSGDRGAVMAWLLTICRSRALDRVRHKRVRAHRAGLEDPVTEDVVCPQPGPEDILDLIQQGTAVHRALKKLTPVRRRLITLAFFRGLSHLEIADECRMPVGTVKSHIRRALAALRAELDEGGADVPSTA